MAVDPNMMDLEFRRSLAETCARYVGFGDPQMPIEPNLLLALLDYTAALERVSHYADSTCGMLKEGGWFGKAEALELQIAEAIKCAHTLNNIIAES
jgi:hypothetical protein